VFGVQSATVVGPGGEEVHVDEFGRVRVQFPWDREAKGDDHGSCWMRVDYAAAGASFGMLVLPHVGQEVLVTFLDGDPDQPVVVGRVYNTVHPVPYKLPEQKLTSGWKSLPREPLLSPSPAGGPQGGAAGPPGGGGRPKTQTPQGMQLSGQRQATVPMGQAPPPAGKRRALAHQQVQQQMQGGGGEGEGGPITTEEEARAALEDGLRRAGASEEQIQQALADFIVPPRPPFSSPGLTPPSVPPPQNNEICANNGDRNQTIYSVGDFNVIVNHHYDEYVLGGNRSTYVSGSRRATVSKRDTTFVGDEYVVAMNREDGGSPTTYIQMADRFIRLTTGKASITLLGGMIDIKAESNITINGARVYINCDVCAP
jgi:hypothetical protein